MKPLTRRLLISAAVVTALILLTLVVGFFVLDQSYPSGGTSNAESDALARKMMASTKPEAWAKTGAVTWTYGGRYNHLWDRERNMVRVRKDGLEVLVDIASHHGVASQDGVALKGKERDEAVDTAWAAWANDSFWLNAPNKAFDPGTTRTLWETPEGKKTLKVEYLSGGVTPGDAYVWHLDPRGRPTSWQMWVSIIPIGGLRASWDGWVQMSTGAWVSTVHNIGPIAIEITDLKGGHTLADVEPGADPFEPLVKALKTR